MKNPLLGFARKALRSLGVGMVVLFVTLPPAAQAQTFWSFPGTSDWFVPGNWSAGVPGPMDNADIDNGGTAVIDAGAATADQLRVANVGTGGLTMEGGTLTAAGMSIALNAGSSGQVVMTEGLIMIHSMGVGNLGVGTFFLADGDVFTDFLVVGRESGSSGLLILNGGAWWNTTDLLVGRDAGSSGELELQAGTLITNSLRVGVLADAVGSFDVSGGTLNTSGALDIGEFGQGEYTQSGGDVTVNALLRFGTGAGSSGVGTITDGTLISNSGIRIGSGGTGQLNVFGGTVGIVGLGEVQLGGATSLGSLIMGDGMNIGVLDVAQVNGVGAPGSAILQFHHAEPDYFFTRDSMSTGDNILISGSTNIFHLGTGTTTIRGANTFTGSTSIFGGRLQTVGNTALGSGGVALLDIDAVLAPEGALQVDGLSWTAGRIALTLGTTSDRIDNLGALSVGFLGGEFEFTDGPGFALGEDYTILTSPGFDPTLLPAFSGNMLLGGTPIFSLDGDNLNVLFAGATSGPFLQNSAPVFVLPTADFSVIGPVQTGTPMENNTVNSLTFAPGSSLQVFNNLTVTSGQFDVTSGPASITGGTVITPGDFFKTGPGTLVTNTNFAVGGAAGINAGGLIVNGSFTAPGGVTVQPGALLGGNGLVAGNVLNRGTVNPGNSTGTLTINGNYTQTSSGRLEMDIRSRSAFDRLVVRGVARLGGALVVRASPSRLAYGDNFAIIEAGSIAGEFDRIEMPRPDRLRGRFLVRGGTGILLVAPTSYTLVAQTPNQVSVARALDSFIPETGNDRETVSIALDFLREEQYPAAFDQIMPTFYETLTDITIEQAFQHRQMLGQRINALRAGARGFQSSGLSAPALVHDRDGKSVFEPKSEGGFLQSSTATPLAWNYWAMANSIFADLRSASQIPNNRFDTGGLFTGLDYDWTAGGSDDLRVTTGFYAGYQYTSANYGDAGRTRINSALFGVYGTYSTGGFYAMATAGGGYHDYSVSRNIRFSEIDRTAKSSPGGTHAVVALDGGYDIEAGNFVFGPTGGLQYTRANVGSFTESGADSLDLRAGSQSADSLRSTLGARLAYTAEVSPTVKITPGLQALWMHEFLNGPRTINAALDGGSGPSFDYLTDSRQRDSLFVGAGVSAAFGDRWNAMVYYNADLARGDFSSHAVSAGFGVAW